MLKRLEPFNIEIETIGVMDTLNDLIFASFEILIEFLLANPESICSAADAQGSKQVLMSSVQALANQDFETISVEGGLRFLALYSKHFPEFLREHLST